MIQFKVSKRWQRATREEFAKRVSDIVRGHVSGYAPFENPQCQNLYILDSGNNWWLEFKGDNICELSYRYPTAVNAMQWAAVKTVIEWAIGTTEESEDEQAMEKETPKTS